MLDTDPVVDASTVTENVNVKLVEGTTPAAIVHVNELPDCDGVQVTSDGTVPQLCEPATNVVPAGTVSVTTTGTVETDVPVFCTPIEYTIGVDEPAATLNGEPDFVTVNAAPLVTVVGVVTVTGQPPEVVHP